MASTRHVFQVLNFVAQEVFRYRANNLCFDPLLSDRIDYLAYTLLGSYNRYHQIYRSYLVRLILHLHRWRGYMVFFLVGICSDGANYVFGAWSHFVLSNCCFFLGVHRWVNLTVPFRNSSDVSVSPFVFWEVSNRFLTECFQGSCDCIRSHMHVTLSAFPWIRRVLFFRKYVTVELGHLDRSRSSLEWARAAPRRVSFVFNRSSLSHFAVKLFMVIRTV